MNTNQTLKPDLAPPADNAEKFEIQYQLRARGVAIIELSGRIDADAVHEFWSTIKEIFHQQHYRLVLDCKRVSYITSSGIGVIASAVSEAQANGGDIVLVKPTVNINYLVSLLGLNELVPQANSLSEALDNFNWWER
jgi:anti-anti-sigma factor